MAALLRFLLVLAFVLLLEAACRLGWIARTVLIPPSAMAASLADILRDGEHTADIVATFTRVLGATVLAVMGGAVGGVILHALPRLRAAADPLLSAYYAVPSFMFYPLFIVLFGVGTGAIIAIGFCLAVVAMLTSTLLGLDRIPGVLRRTARIYRMGRWETARRILLPAILPHLLVGMRLAVAYAFIGVIASEFILSGSGLGYAIAYAYNNFDNATMYGLMLLVIVAVTAVNATLARLTR